MKIILTLIITLTLISGVYALGIATDYGSDYLRLPQGTKHYKYSFRIQNMEDGALPVRIELNDPNGVAKLVGETDEYIIQPKTTDNEFFFDITLPQKAEIGEKYNIKYKIRTGSSGKGQITFGRAVGKEFTIEVIKSGENSVGIWFKGLGENVENIFNKMTGNITRVIGIKDKVWIVGFTLVLIAGTIGLITWKKSR